MKNFINISAILAASLFLNAEASSCINALCAFDESVGISIKREIFQFRENPNGAQNYINARLLEKYEFHKNELKQNLVEILSCEDCATAANLSLCVQTKLCVNSPKLFSAKNSYYIYSGGANGMSYEEGFNFEISGDSAKEIKLSELFNSESEWKPVLLKLAIKSVLQKFPDIDILLSSDEIQAADTFEKVVSGFVLTSQGMEILFPKYSISCGAAGCLFAKVEYSELEKYLSERGRKLFKEIGGE